MAGGGYDLPGTGLRAKPALRHAVIVGVTALSGPPAVGGALRGEYVIFKEGGRVKASNRRTGEVLHEGEAPREDGRVLQQTVDHIAGPRIAGAAGDRARRRATARITLLDDLHVTQVDLTDLHGLEIEGGGHQNGAIAIHVSPVVPSPDDPATANPVGFDLTNSRFLRFSRVHFRTRGHPDGRGPPMFLLARDAAGASAGNHTFQDCDFHDHEVGEHGRVWSRGGPLVYNYGAEEVHFVRCYFHHAAGGAVILTERNLLGLRSPYLDRPSSGRGIATGKQSMLQNTFTGCAFVAGAPGSRSVHIEGGGNHVFDKCYFGGGGSGRGFDRYAFELWQEAGEPTEVQGLWIRDSRFECRVITSATPRGARITLSALRLEGCAVDAGTAAQRERKAGGPRVPWPIVDLDKFDGDHDVVVRNAVVSPSMHFPRLQSVAYRMSFRVIRSSQLWLRHAVGDGGAIGDQDLDLEVQVSGQASGCTVTVWDKSSFAAGVLDRMTVDGR